MTKLCFTGDICIGGRFKEKLLAGESLFSLDLLNKLSEMDFVCGNFEGPETDIEQKETSGIALKNAVGSLAYLKQTGVNVLNLANNHIADFGNDGLFETINTLNRLQLGYLGASKKEKAHEPLIIKKDNVSIAIISFLENDGLLFSRSQKYVATMPRFIELKEQIERLKKNNHWVVLMYHGGEEFSTVPSPQKRNLLKKIALKTKVDVIVSHHSHTFQGVESINGTPVFYSLGNFVFDLLYHEIYPQTRESALVVFDFSEKTFHYKFVPIGINAENGIVGSNDSAFEKVIGKRSEFSDYKKNWQKECYRLVFNRPQHKILNPIETSLQGKPLWRSFFIFKLYKRIFVILSNSKLRSLYFSALTYKYTQEFDKTFSK